MLLQNYYYYYLLYNAHTLSKETIHIVTHLHTDIKPYLFVVIELYYFF